MTTSQTPYEQINNLEKLAFIAGTDFTLTFDVYDDVGAPINLSSSTCTWKMCNYGETDAVLTKSGVVSSSPSNRFTVSLASADTIGLEGVFIHQPIVADLLGNQYRTGQGIIILQAAIA